MSDIRREPTRRRSRTRPRHEIERGKSELDEFWEKEAARRDRRNFGWIQMMLGGAGGLSALVLIADSISYYGSFYGPFLVTGAIAGTACGVMALGGLKGIWTSSPMKVLSGSYDKKSIVADTRTLERVVLEVIEDHGEVTPARVALETTCTVEEAEEILSRLAEKGHLDVRVDGGRLVYSL